MVFGKPRTYWKKRGHRSRLETNFNELCLKDGVTLGYETSVLAFTIPAKEHKYTPDWTIKEGWYIETKGRLDLDDRKKLVWIKEQHPGIRILVVFQRPQSPLYKGSKSTYGSWATKEGIEWCAFEDQATWKAFISEAYGFQINGADEAEYG